MLDRETLRASWRAWWTPDPAFGCQVGPGWLQFVWTFLFNSGMALLLTVVAASFGTRLNVLETLRWNFVISQFVGFSIHGLFWVVHRMLGPARVRALGPVAKVVLYAGVPITGVLIGYSAGMTLMGVDVPALIIQRPNILLAIVLLSILMTAFWYRYLTNRARLAEAQAEQARSEARANELERQAVTARLQALQAQIEPHFLFNTLATVVSLIDIDPARARGMLERLIELLRSSLAASRERQGTLGQELALLTPYLEILKVRMGRRLSYRVDVPPELHDAVLPPLTLQPLVENAVRHGLEPKIAGGSVQVHAQARDGELLIEVVDDGVGFAPHAGNGVGLTNVRERLRSEYGNAARFTVEEAGPGTRVRLGVPLELPRAAQAEAATAAKPGVRADAGPTQPSASPSLHPLQSR